MKKLFAFSLGLFCLLTAAADLCAAPKDTLQPLFSFRTNIYQEQGASNVLSIVLGVTDSTYLYVDFGAGEMEYEVGPAYYDSTSTAVKGTYIEGTVTSAGKITVYGTAADALLIDYINADGCYITDIDLTKLPNLDILSLNHNVLSDIDLSQNKKIEALYISDNEFTASTPLRLGEKPVLKILELQNVTYFDPAFDMTQYPSLQSFDAYHCPTLTRIDPTACDSLLQLTLEMTNVKTLDVSKNKYLLILNISETGITELDLSHNPWLQQLYCEHVSGVYNVGAKLDKLDLTHCPLIYRLSCNGNNLSELDVTNLTYLISLSCMNNNITSLDLSNCKQLSQVKIDGNRMDFATLPLPQDTWEEYTYAQQKFPVARSYQEGTVLDYSDRVLRAGTTTEAALYTFDATTPDTWTMLDTTYYSYSNGVVTLKKAYKDSLFIAFANSLFSSDDIQQIYLYTEHFMVKTAGEYGRPSEAFSFTPTTDTITLSLGIAGATAAAPKTFYVCFNSDTVLTAYTTDAATVDATPVTFTAPWSYSTVHIYVPEGSDVSAINLEDNGLSGIELNKVIGLEQLDLSGTGIYNVDLSYNRWLQSLDLSNNNLYGAFTLAGVNSLFAKNVLKEIYLNNNQITELTLNPPLAIRLLDISHNAIESLDLSDADSIVAVKVNDNKFTSLDFTHCEALLALDASHNALTQITLPTDNHLQSLYLDNNQFTYATLPARGNIEENDYHYAPQADIVIATVGPCADLSTQTTAAGGTKTVFEWVKADGTTLVEGTDYTLTDGFTRFLNTEAGKVYCRMTNAGFPSFADGNELKTTVIEVAGMPTNEIASFVTSADKDTVELSLAAAKDGTAVYIDWSGNGNVTQYVLGTTYRVFTSPAVTHKDTTVRVYTYSAEDTVSVFSMTGASLRSFDGSNLNTTRSLTVQRAGLSDITLPANKQALRELNLSENNFTKADWASYPNLVLLAIGSNKFTSIDVSKNTELQLLSAGLNDITTVTMKNPNLWMIDLSGNLLQSVDLSGVPYVEQLNLANNYLTTVDVENLLYLRALSLTGNAFDFQTLPRPKSQYIQYYFYNQAQLSVSVTKNSYVDLSRQAQVGDSLTTYKWYLDIPVWNSETSQYEGEELIEGTEYTVTNGVTTFLKSFDGVMCLMTNGMFPSLYLYTGLLDVQGTTAIDNATADGISVRVQGNGIVVTTETAQPVSLYAVSGALVAQDHSAAGDHTFRSLPSGAYLLLVGTTPAKVLIP